MKGSLTPSRTQGATALQRRGRRPARGDPPAAARRVPPVAGHPRRARRAGSEGAQATPSDGARRDRGGDRPRRAVQPRRHQPGACQGARRLRADLLARDRADKRYPETDADVAATCAQLARYGVDPSSPPHVPHGRRPPGPRCSSSSFACVAARSPERHVEGLRDLQQLAELAQRVVVADLLA